MTHSDTTHMMVKLVVFDLGGVVATNPFFAIQKYAWEKGIPRFVKKRSYASLAMQRARLGRLLRVFPTQPADVAKNKYELISSGANATVSISLPESVTVSVEVYVVGALCSCAFPCSEFRRIFFTRAILWPIFEKLKW